MNKYITSGLVATVLAAGGIGYFSYAATLSDKSEIDEIVDTLTDEEMKVDVVEPHVPDKADLDKQLILDVLSDLKEIRKNNGYTGIARKRKISRSRVKQIEKSINQEKMDRLPKEVEEI